MVKKIKDFFKQLSPKVRNIVAYFTLGTIITSIITPVWYYHSNLVQENKELKNELINGQMTLWVKNDTKETRNFFYRDKLEGKGQGIPISAGRIQSFKIKKGVYDWHCYDAKKGTIQIDTIKKGELIFKYLQQKELIVLDQ